MIRKSVKSWAAPANFEILQAVVNDLADHGDTIVCGDLNARIGNIADFDPPDNSAEFIDLPSNPNTPNHLPKKRFNNSSLAIEKSWNMEGR